MAIPFGRRAESMKDRNVIMIEYGYEHEAAGRLELRYEDDGSMIGEVRRGDEYPTIWVDIRSFTESYNGRKGRLLRAARYLHHLYIGQERLVLAVTRSWDMVG